jgi:hypothetical protein
VEERRSLIGSFSLKNKFMLNEQVKRFRLACGVPGPNDGTSLLRGYGPLNAMLKEDLRLELVQPPSLPSGDWEMNWAWLTSCDALFMQRPFTPKHAQVIVMAKMAGLPVWVDWDDDLCSVPAYNPKADLYVPEVVRPNIDRITRLADMVTVSTEALLKSRTEALGKLLQADGNRGPSTAGKMPAELGKVRVIPNACMWPFSDLPRCKRISWRGGASHDGDLMHVLPTLNELSRAPQLSLWKWLFIGDINWMVPDAIPQANFEHDPGADVYLYMRIFQQLAPFVHIVPFANNPFNRARSNLAWLEATSAGAVVLAPDWEEWRRPGIINFRDMDEFKARLKVICSQFRSADGVHPNVHESRRFISENLLLPVVNRMRWDLLNELATGVAATAPAARRELPRVPSDGRPITAAEMADGK